MKKISILLLVVVAALSACKKTPEVNLKYVDVERDLITVGTTTATVQCDYEYITTLKKAFFYYGEGTEEVDMNTAEMRVVQNTLYVDLAGLRENTTYSYYYEFVNGFNSMRSAAKTFQTEASPVTPPEITLPTVVTSSVTETTTNSAKGGGEVTNDGGAEVMERGICWSKNANPTINNNHVAAGTGTGAFTAMMSELEANTTYHVRAYAINEKGTAYGLDREFVTLSGGGSGNAPIGAINGLFTINENGDQVYFSQGNLQYQASTNTWKFAENQWDFVGDETQGNVYENGVKCDNALVSSTYDGWIDLFYWGTSGFSHGANCYQPWSTSTDETNYYAYGIETCNLYDQTGMADWGYNPIFNGGGQEKMWRVLTYDEWRYILFERETSSGTRFAKALVNGVKGLIILPDDWSASGYSLISINDGNTYFSQNTISAEDWQNHFQYFGGVFLPCALNRLGTTVCYESGDYWSSTRKLDDDFAYDICIRDDNLEFSCCNGCLAQSVRLVQYLNTPPTPPSGELEYVDLGLPSGTLWATCNVGANSPEEYGDYFAWGETQEKESFFWSNYKYCNGSKNTLIKYCNNSDYGYNGYTDSLAILQSEDDAAATNWGFGWRMPTMEEFWELKSNTTQTWTTLNGVNGRLFTGENGNTLFLPAAGNYWNNGINYIGIRGDYWTSSLYLYNPSTAWVLAVEEDGSSGVYAYSRRYGFSIRPVRTIAK